MFTPHLLKRAHYFVSISATKIGYRCSGSFIVGRAYIVGYFSNRAEHLDREVIYIPR